MPKFRVAIDYHVSITYEVEADDEEKAVEKAVAIEEPKDTWTEKIWDSIEFADAWVVEEIKEAFEERPMPGQEPYTPEERAKLAQLVADAAEAEELLDPDELERYAEERR